MRGVAFDRRTIELAPSRAFGDGSHDTTRVCLEALKALAPRGRDGEWRLLDFGSGTGILSIAAAMVGAREALGIEIDEDAIAVAAENARLNDVVDRVRLAPSLDDAKGTFDVVVANILADVLVTFARDLVARLARDGLLILSGLVATDGPRIIATYAPLLGERRPEIYERGDWRALVWRARQR